MINEFEDPPAKEGTKVYEFSCPYCGKAFKGSNKEFNKCFNHQWRSHKKQSNISPSYPINHCRIFYKGKWWSFIP